MIFRWDEQKNRSNQRKHGLTFETGMLVFDDPNAVFYPERVVEGEERWHAVGRAGGVTILVVVHTVAEDNGEETTRIISVRKANRRERTFYPSPH